MKNSQIKVCHMTSVHKRYDARILKKECCTLVANGYDVTLIVADNKPEENYNGVKIVSSNFKPKNRLDRIINLKKYIFAKAIEINADIYHFHDPELIPVGLDLLKRGKKVIYDCHEDYEEDIKDKSWIPHFLRPFVAYIFKCYERHSAKYFNIIITVTPSIVEKFERYHDNVYMVTNYPIIHTKQTDAIKQPQICFTGLISPLWCQEVIVSALNLLNDPIKYVIAGPASEDYLNTLRNLDVKGNMFYLGYLSSDDVDKVQRSSLAGLAVLRYCRAVGGNLGTLGNNKLFEYMSAGIPVICTDFVLWKNIIDKWKCGICVCPQDPTQVASAITFLLKNPDIAYSMGESGRKAVESEFNWDTQATILLEAYRSIK